MARSDASIAATSAIPSTKIGSRTSLTDSQYKQYWRIIAAFLRKNPSIRNRQMREISDIGYDQAISFFNRATSEKRLVRKGKSGGTHYVLAK